MNSFRTREVITSRMRESNQVTIEPESFITRGGVLQGILRDLLRQAG